MEQENKDHKRIPTCVACALVIRWSKRSAIRRQFETMSNHILETIGTTHEQIPENIDFREPGFAGKQVQWRCKLVAQFNRWGELTWRSYPATCQFFVFNQTSPRRWIRSNAWR